MSIIRSIKGKDRLLLDGFRYRRDRLVWRCVKDNSKGRARYDGVVYEPYRDHTCQAPDPDEIEKSVYNYEIRKFNVLEPIKIFQQNLKHLLILLFHQNFN